MIIRNYLFHRVSPVKDELWEPMSPELFENIIKHLNNKFHIVNLEETFLSNSIKQHSKPLATISFDDGYKDNIEYAFNILNKYKVPASFYVITDCVDRNIPTWTFIIDYLFQNTKKISIDFNKDLLPESLKSTTWKNKTERINYARKFKPYLKHINNKDRVYLYNQVVLAIDDVEYPKIMMTWDDINQIMDKGFSIGSHSVTHPMLATIEDDTILHHELNDSALKLLKMTGKFPVSISYPIGSYNNKVIEMSKKVGYKLGIAVNQKFYHSEKNNLFEIPRMELFNEPWFKTKLRISGTLDAIKRIIR